MAEVLITLGIIGVVAAMTLPTLVQHYKRKEATSRLKKFYSAMSQAVMFAENDFGPAITWEKAPADIENADGTIDHPAAMADATWAYWSKYLAPYIKYLKAVKGVYNEENPKAFFEVKVYLSDGTTITMHNGYAMDIFVDVNGDNPPNKFGIDEFFFMIKASGYETMHPKKSFSVPYEHMYPTREQAMAICKTSPVHCSILLYYDNFEFKDDYPYKL